jgi:undecaprenyl pyrophosphate phosphatase UppP
MISILISLVIIGLLLWLVNNYVPMDSKIKSILNVIVVIAVMVWLLQAFGLIGGVGLR